MATKPLHPPTHSTQSPAHNPYALVLFAAVAKHLNFRKAAAELTIPPATLSRRIAALETELGVQLLQRTTRRVRLTRAGTDLLARTEAPLAALLDARLQLVEEHTEPTGLVRIATTRTFIETNIYPVLAELQRAYPAIRLELIVSPHPADLRFENIDLAIRGGRMSDESLVAKKLGVHTFACYARADVADTASLPLLSYSDHLRFGGTPWLEVADAGLLHRMVREGLGRAWLITELCAIDEAEGVLARCEGSPEKAYAYYLVYPSRQRIARRVRIVIDALMKYARRAST